MTFSDDTNNVLNALDYISGNSLRKRNDIASIIEICATYDGFELLNNVIFTGKSVWNLQSKINKISDSDEGAHLIKNELLNNIEKLRRHIIEISEKADNDSKKRFQEIYLSENQGGLKNLIDLSFDLSIFKELQNQNKRMSK